MACPGRRILGMRVDATSYAETAGLVHDLAAAGAGGMVCVATTHMVMEAFDSPGFRRIVNAADRVTPDGVPLVWALRAMGVSGATRVYGPTLMPEVCARAAASGIPVGLYGGTPEVLALLRAELRRRFPALEIPFGYSPPFRPLTEEEDREVVDTIAASGVRILFVGIGCPRQEHWMAAHRDRVDAVMIGVGAAFDFLAGVKAQAPRWLQDAGLEWLFRLVHEPRRLWRRYLVGNARFVFHFLLRGNRG
ncbi:MAG: WecB/TagA/CpsF family glycosyltransferase [Myxococcota bacterium]|nr:WecB/TagA/CpsF family glycosyltransferase [Myxococcota bacterium]